MGKKFFRVTGLLWLFGIVFIFGCGGGKEDSEPLPPPPTTDLTGTLTIPATVNPQLITASILSAQSTDSEIRNAFASASVWVNDAVIANRVITPSAVNSEWDFRLFGVPQSSNGIYRILVMSGRLALRSSVKAVNKHSFSIDSRTTAAALLADSSGIEANDLMASFPAMVSKVALQVESAFNAANADVKGSIFNLTSLKAEVASQADFLKKNKDFDPNALAAYLGNTNDLDGNGIPDLRITQTTDRTGIRFETAISSLTTLLENVQRIGSYSDRTLFEDFAKGNVRNDRTFDSSAKNFALGFFFKKGAEKDLYLKLLVKRIDLSEGTFAGVFAEYAFATATGTAVSTGTKTLFMKGLTGITGAIEATNFLTDSVATEGFLVYLDSERGLGSPDGRVKMIRAVDGQPELSKLSSAEFFSETATGYQTNTTNALKAINKNRTLEAGDVFAVYFKTFRIYALVKVKSIGGSTITLDYKVNGGVDEPRF